MKKNLLTTIVTLVMAAQAMPQATQLANNEGLQMLGLLNNNRAVFYSIKTSMLWVTNGTAAGTVSFTNKVSVPATPECTVMNGLLYFTGADAATGEELWVTDGTDAGTHLVKDINPGAASSSPADRLLVFNNRIYFSGETGTGGREMWMSDGTAAGTVMIKDIVPGAGSSNQPALYKATAAGNYIYFVCNTTAEGEELWRTDGTAAGTVLIQDIKTGPLSSTPIILGVYNNKLVFSAEDLLHGREPWMTDGTAAGTNLLKDIATGPMSSSADNFIEFNGKMLFAAFDITNGQELWQTDGTTAGTQLLKDIQTGDWGSAPILYNAIKVGNKLFFAAFSNDAGMELWQTDGTTAGTQLFMDIEAGEGDAIPIILPAYANGFGTGSRLFQGNKFFFAAFTAASGCELYISDGTVAGTNMIKDLDGDIEDGFTFNGYYISNTGIYFSGNDGVHKGELFKSDGTAAGTGLAASVNMVGGDGKTMPFVIINNALLFFGDDGNNPTEELNDLYRLNVNDVVLPVNIISFNGKNEGSKNVLSWKATNAVNFEKFIVERSSDGNNFTAVGAVNWKDAADYSFTDNNITSSNILYYRLRLTDRNNSFKYSTVIALRNNNISALDFKATKNGNSMLVNYHLAGNEGNIRVTDISGRNLYKSKITGNSGHLRIDVPSANQLFIITIQEGSNSISKRVF